MFQSPDHYHNLSLNENIWNLNIQLNIEDGSVFFFGSQTEGSTTLELKSDIDLLWCINGISVIQDWSEWKLGKLQLLMVQDETTSPGYCLLQLVRPDMPLPVQDIQHRDFTTDSRGRVLMKHSAFFYDMINGRIRHGPARTVNGIPHQCDNDMVWALHCSPWPIEANSWIQRQNASRWPTANIKRYAIEHGCFVVAVASQANRNGETEWRISTSHAERCLMFSLNMTQMRCYILMKMIIKTFLKPKYEDTISSFMCKNVLFHCIADTRASEWNDSNLLACFNQCLQYLLHCILTENCPHFIIPANNLLAGKLSFQTKQQVVEIMMTLTANIEQSLLGISIDEVGNRIRVKSGGILLNRLRSVEQIAGAVLACNVCSLARGIKSMLRVILKTNSCYNSIAVYQNLVQNVSKLCSIYSAGSRLEQAACCLWSPPLCAVIGSVIASVNIHHSQPVSPAAQQWFSAGLNSDFSSSRLKLASALYCARHYEQCETILVHLNTHLEQTTVLTICSCFRQPTQSTLEYQKICLEKTEEKVIKQNMAFCVNFLPCEVNCVPEELRYEMFRSTEEDLPYRGRDDYWMDWAVVNSIPFLYFLQYKVYSQLHRPEEQQQQTLNNLARTINNDPNLSHRETALNLLGQCMEQENIKDKALRCYMMSLKVRPRNNAAKWHMCKLLAGMFNNRFSGC